MLHHITYPNLAKQFSHGIGNAMQTNVQRKFAHEGTELWKREIAHFGLFLLLFGTQKNVNAEN